ncbi:SGNH/GDSL hydrolase family protein [Antarcticibacterium sp. 1MA-6-2]|uniref:SGNH/GDSL hydrolase family protein n=1 Tax=Antarcticibacterium sp. 1MA-6-2 TaxID=2908210 RepID=UPI001F37E54A|nr:SGNH/GDSL hydrolase family protein [Antarcticibacterium sp. 1MA-6-2]UJH90686.1 SGNH/GDSL hydrolase family protein [Antarcticibacterium sp. 1MA-6-2]
MKKLFLLLLVIFSNNTNLYSQDSEFDKLMQQDWANLQKYSSDNKKLQEEQVKPSVVFMGNSITEGWARANPQFFSNNNFVGRGISGQTTPQMLIRFFPDVIDLNPEAVVILAGTNDIAGNTGASTVKMITNNITAMAQLAQANGIKVILASILPTYNYPWRTQIKPIEKITEINEWLKEYAEENNHTYLDLYSALVDHRKGLKAEYSEDGVHPNEKGYSVMEPLAKEAIRQTLSK